MDQVDRVHEDTSEAPTSVLFIGGLGRSGSTLLDLLLGSQEGFCAVGELSAIWRRGLIENELCGCGAAFLDCPFWSEVGRHAFGGWETVDGQAMAALQRSVDRNRYIPMMTGLLRRPWYERELVRYSSMMARLYRAIATASASSVVVDSTKHASSAFMLARSSEIDLRIVHLVRDARGVAHSWTKAVRKPEVTAGAAYLDRYRPVRIGARWLGYNALFHAVRRPSVPSVFVRYEDLVRAPEEWLGRIIRLAGRGSHPEHLTGIDDGRAEVTGSHTIAGNPMRFSSKTLRLAVDDAWRRDMQPKDRIAVTAMTLPLLAAYGYLRRSHVP